MSLLTNNNTIHLYNRWCSPWYENSNIYSNLIYSDLYIYELINGVYYQLNIPTSIPFYKELNYNQLIIRINAHLFKKRKQKKSSMFYYNKTDFFYNYKKIMFLLHKTLFNKKQFKKKFYKKVNSINLKNNIFLKYFCLTFKKIKNKSVISNKKNDNVYFHFLKNNKISNISNFIKIFKNNKKYLKKNNKLKNTIFNKKNIILLKKYKKTKIFFINKKRLYQKKKLHLTKKKKKI